MWHDLTFLHSLPCVPELPITLRSFCVVARIMGNQWLRDWFQHFDPFLPLKVRLNSVEGTLADPQLQNLHIVDFATRQSPGQVHAMSCPVGVCGTALDREPKDLLCFCLRPGQPQTEFCLRKKEWEPSFHMQQTLALSQFFKAPGHKSEKKIIGLTTDTTVSVPKSFILKWKSKANSNIFNVVNRFEAVSQTLWLWHLIELYQINSHFCKAHAWNICTAAELCKHLLWAQKAVRPTSKISCVKHGATNSGQTKFGLERFHQNWKLSKKIGETAVTGFLVMVTKILAKQQRIKMLHCD